VVARPPLHTSGAKPNEVLDGTEARALLVEQQASDALGLLAEGDREPVRDGGDRRAVAMCLKCGHCVIHEGLDQLGPRVGLSARWAA